MTTTIEFKPLSFGQRLKMCFLNNPTILGAITGLIMFFFILIPLHKAEGIEILLVIMLAVIITAIALVISKIREARFYIQKVVLTGNNVEFTYYVFNTKKQIFMVNEFLKVEHPKFNLKTFMIVHNDGGLFKTILQQNRIGEWTKDENLKVLKEMLNKGSASVPKGQ